MKRIWLICAGFTIGLSAAAFVPNALEHLVGKGAAPTPRQIRQMLAGERSLDPTRL